MIELAAGGALGLAGSAHCVGMCGPLLVAVGRSFASTGRHLQHAAIYHAGRVATYALLGLAAGAFGSTLRVAGLGRAIAVGSGLLLIAAAIADLRVPHGLGLTGGWSARIARVAAAAHRWGARRPVAGPLATGALNGLLPCGLTYAAVTAALALGTSASAVAFMVGFGLGTVPALVALALTASAVPPSVRLRLRRLAPAALVVLGALLIARGLTPQAHRHTPAASAQTTHSH